MKNLLGGWLMNDVNLEKWELKIKVSKRRILGTKSVAEVNHLVLFDNCMQVGYFICTRLLMDFEKSDPRNNMKPQDITANIIMHDLHARTNSDSNINFIPRSELFSYKNDCNNDLDNASMCSNIVGNNENTENDLISEEGEGSVFYQLISLMMQKISSYL